MKNPRVLIIGLILAPAFFASASLGSQRTGSGALKGMITGADGRQALAGAAVVLCPMTSEGECRLRADLMTSADKNGRFAFSEVPAGKYVVLYDPLGKALSTWKTIDGLTINFAFGRPQKIGGFMTKEFFETFGGGEAVSISKGTFGSSNDGKISSLEGSFTSTKYGLTFDFRGGKPLLVEVIDGQTAEFKIAAWGR